MEKKLASQLKQLVNQPEYPRLMDLYITERKQRLHDMLACERDTHQIFRLQGQLAELNVLSKLRDMINNTEGR